MNSDLGCGIGSLLCTPFMNLETNSDRSMHELMPDGREELAKRQPIGRDTSSQTNEYYHIARSESRNSSLASYRSSSLSSQDSSSEFLGDRVAIARPGLVVVRGGCHFGVVELLLHVAFDIRMKLCLNGGCGAGEGIEISTVSTANPLVLRFYPNMPVLKCISGELAFCCKSQYFSHRSPLAAKLLKLNGIEELTLTSEYLEIKRTCHRHTSTQSQMLCSVSWRNIKPKILAILIDHFASGQPVVEQSVFANAANPFLSSEDSSLIIKDLVETRIRPLVKQQGGDVIFIEYRRLDRSVFLSLYGTCVSSPNATKILRNLILQLLQFHVPDVENIVEVSTPHHKDIR